MASSCSVLWVAGQGAAQPLVQLIRARCSSSTLAAGSKLPSATKTTLEEFCLFSSPVCFSVRPAFNPWVLLGQAGLGMLAGGVGERGAAETSPRLVCSPEG